MPLSNDERRALQTHSRKIDDYESRRDAEKARLEEPYKDRRAELWDLATSDGGPTSDPRVRRCRGNTTDERTEAFALLQKVETGLFHFDAANKPALEPWDTPAKILKELNERATHWNGRGLQLLRYGGYDPSPAEWSKHESEKALEAYLEFRERIRRFQNISPSVIEDVSGTVDPMIGAKQMANLISDWCESAMRRDDADDVPLSERHKHLLIAMLELEAFDSDHRKTAAVVVMKAVGGDGNDCKRPLAELVKWGLASSIPKAGGGYWLTPAGRERADKLATI